MSPYGTKEPKEDRPRKRDEAEPVVKVEPPRRLVAARDFSIWTGKVLTHYPKGSVVEIDVETAKGLVLNGQAEWR